MTKELDENHLQMLVTYQLLITTCVCGKNARCQRCRLLDSARIHWADNYNKATAIFTSIDERKAAIRAESNQP